jgi:NADH-quinone oxidoreductase subunit M
LNAASHALAWPETDIATEVATDRRTLLGMELLLEGAVDTYPYVGTAVVLAAALNGTAVVQTYFFVFTGGQRRASISLRSRVPEKAAVFTLSLLLLDGMFPQPGISSRRIASRNFERTKPIIESTESSSEIFSRTGARRRCRQ